MPWYETKKVKPTNMTSWQPAPNSTAAAPTLVARIITQNATVTTTVPPALVEFQLLANASYAWVTRRELKLSLKARGPLPLHP